MEANSGEGAPKRKPLPSALVSNLESVLAVRRPPPAEEVSTAAASAEAEAPAAEASDAPPADGAPARPVVLLTCAGGIQSPGLAALVDALVAGGRCDVHVCAPDSDKQACGHSITVRETITATSVDFKGAKAFEISELCRFHSSAIAAAREALVYGVPSIAISLNWKKDESKDSDFKDAAQACLPLINAALADIEKGNFVKGCLLNIGFPSSPSANKGFKLTKQSGYSPAQSWQAVSTNRPSSAVHFMGMHQSLGIQLAQLGKDASAAGAARRVSAQRKTVEVESVAAAGKQEAREVVKKLFRAEFVEKQHEDLNEDIDLRAMENGFISVTPLNVHGQVEAEIGAPVSDWLSAVVAEEKEDPSAA
ncbi:hypothetical protein C2845_PM08G23430 [Panicum miliaceum]|uniref:Survival protein SurE-like phosphatase/nucleotidase domain-containing protein n=1 Tax=Panicum miliaceum TaxID=4540 RepID=A0A3L6R2M5_PANMI|nr:hypothetical protein C2845_PM08G23430 [Panicum miliaceum]